MKKIMIYSLILGICMVFLGYQAFAGGGYAEIINKSKPGMEIDINPHAEKGKITIFDFYSQGCGPCKQIAPYLEKLDKKQDDIVVKKIDINRKGVGGIDWSSPVVKQYKIRSVPYFLIYNKDGKPDSKGSSAYKKVVKYLKEAGLE